MASSERCSFPLLAHQAVDFTCRKFERVANSSTAVADAAVTKPPPWGTAQPPVFVSKKSHLSLRGWQTPGLFVGVRIMLTVDEVVQLNRRCGRGLDASGKPRPFTAQEFFDVSALLGNNQDNPEYRGLFEHLARWLVATLPQVRSTVEFGAGPGYLIECLTALGIDATGIDGNDLSAEYFRKRRPDLAQRYLIDPEFAGNYAQADVLLAIEVFEHILDPALSEIMEKVRRAIKPRFIVFSSTPYADHNEGWDIQWGHINIKQQAEWDGLFARYQYLRVNIRPPVTAWAALYVDANAFAVSS